MKNRMFRFFKDFFIYGMASLLGKIAAIFLMPLYTNILTKEEYGAMALITSVQGLIGLVSNLNIHSGIARDYYEEGIDRKKLVSTGFLSILSLSLSIMAIGLMTRHFWGMQVLGLDEKFIPAFTVLLLNVPAGSLMSYFSILTRFKKKPVSFAVGSVIQLIIQLTISIVGVVVMHAGIISIFLGMLAGELFALVYFAILNKEHLGFKFDKAILRRALVFAVPTLPAILAGWLDSSMGQILIGKHISMEELGVYSVALSIASVFTLISTALQNVWAPFLYENYTKPDFNKLIRKLFSIIALVLVMITLLFAMFSREVVLILSNKGYLDAGKYIILLCIPMSFYLMFPFASSGVSISRDTKYIGISYVAGSCINLLFLYLTIGRLGVLAVPLCLAASRVLSFFMLYSASEKKIGYRLPVHLLLILVLVAVGGYFVVSLQLGLLTRAIIAMVAVSLLAVYVNKHFDLKSVIASFKEGQFNTSNT